MKNIVQFLSIAGCALTLCACGGSNEAPLVDPLPKPTISPSSSPSASPKPSMAPTPSPSASPKASPSPSASPRPMTSASPTSSPVATITEANAEAVLNNVAKIIHDVELSDDYAYSFALRLFDRALPATTDNVNSILFHTCSTSGKVDIFPNFEDASGAAVKAGDSIKFIFDKCHVSSPPPLQNESYILDGEFEIVFATLIQENIPVNRIHIGPRVTIGSLDNDLKDSETQFNYSNLSLTYQEIDLTLDGNVSSIRLFSPKSIAKGKLVTSKELSIDSGNNKVDIKDLVFSFTNAESNVGPSSLEVSGNAYSHTLDSHFSIKTIEPLKAFFAEGFSSGRVEFIAPPSTLSINYVAEDTADLSVDVDGDGQIDFTQQDVL